jgi:hypothetical protein
MAKQHTYGPSSASRADHPPTGPFGWLYVETAAGLVLSNHAHYTDLVDLMPRIAPRRVLLIRGMQGG